MARLQKTNAERGFALIEGLICLPLFITTAFTVFFVGAVLLIQMGLSFEAHRALICLKEERPPHICKQELKAHSQKWMLFGKVEKITFQGSPENLSRLHLYWNVKDHLFHVQREISWKKVLRKKVFLP